ncbi:MAG: AraC family transcriptional regulator [Chitinophagales bacterium]|nr:AraC family transcriptional regulator [Chitinophagales bacterium]
MKPVLEHLPKENEESFVVKYFDYPCYPTPWHYHPEYELVLVTESTGKRFIGDNITNFAPGNLAFIGPNLPHTYQNDKAYILPKSKLRAKSIVIHFSEDSLGKDFLKLPESLPVKNLFNKSLKGIDVAGQTNTIIAKKLEDILTLSGLKRWFCLMDILVILAESKDLIPICKTSLIGNNEKESKRLSLVMNWILREYEKEIRVAEAAAMCGMSENAFSRFFSQRTRKTFSGYITELRLHKACKLLKENELSVTSICYDCGFNNVSNFNRQFLKEYKMSPVKYRKLFLDTGV